MTLTANIDGDIILYAVGFASETRVYVCTDGSEFDNAKEANSYCKQHKYDKILRRDPAPDHVWKGNANTMIKNIVKEAGAEAFMIYFSAPNNFRKDIYPEYKANRKDVPRPYCYHELKAYIEDKYPCSEIIGYEADDLLGIYQTDDTILCSIDKDLDQIVGKHYNWKRKQLYSMCWNDAEYNLYIQVLMGDATDNIKGLPGVGEKKAEKILEDVREEDYEAVCQEEYKDRGLTPEDYALTKQLVYIRREFFDEAGEEVSRGRSQETLLGQRHEP